MYNNIIDKTYEYNMILIYFFVMFLAPDIPKEYYHVPTPLTMHN